MGEKTSLDEKKSFQASGRRVVIECFDLGKKFNEKEILKCINLTVESGEIIGLLGPSGAGKTTLIKLLTGQLKPSSGGAALFGTDTRNLPRKDYSNIGMMMDNFGLYERLSVYDNLKLFARIHDIPKERIDQVLHEVGLSDAGTCAVSKLSKGMRGRLSLARAVLNEPAILFLDEPTSGLDTRTANEIHQLIRNQQMKGATIFLTTHNMAEAEKLCNHVALLNEGTIVEYGEPKEICRRYNHQNVIRIQFHDGTGIELPNQKTSADRIGDYLQREQIAAIHSSEPDLESVFMELTGRSLE